MRPLHYITALILFGIAGGIIAYKLLVLNLSFIPLKALDMWKIEISIEEKKIRQGFADHPKKLYLPIPEDGPGQEIHSNLFTVRNPHIVPMEEHELWEVDLTNPQAEKLTMSSVISLKGNTDISKYPISRLTWGQRQKYLDTSHLGEELSASFKDLLDSLLLAQERKSVKLEKIYFFMVDEVVLNPEIDDVKEVMSLKTGSYLGQARFSQALIRMAGIPSRIALGIKILDQGTATDFKYTRVFYNEVYFRNRWIPIIPDTKKIGVIPKNFIVMGPLLHENMEQLHDRNYFSIYLDAVKYAFNDTKANMQQLLKVDSFWADFSLHKFPLSIQTLFFTVLLIPFGTVILSLARVFIGVNTFGIFTPILLTLFFLETSLLSGIVFILVVAILGFIMRYILDRFHLLAVPRLSILLTSVILIYLGLALVGYRFDLLDKTNNTLNYFPIVIISVFIERFSIYFIEEGFRNTMKTLLGTMFVSVLAYLLFSVKILKVILFNYPELLLVAIGCNILIGGYTGFRLTELMRFRPLLK